MLSLYSKCKGFCLFVCFNSIPRWSSGILLIRASGIMEIPMESDFESSQLPGIYFWTGISIFWLICFRYGYSALKACHQNDLTELSDSALPHHRRFTPWWKMFITRRSFTNHRADCNFPSCSDITTWPQSWVLGDGVCGSHQGKKSGLNIWQLFLVWG